MRGSTNRWTHGAVARAVAVAAALALAVAAAGCTSTQASSGGASASAASATSTEPAATFPATFADDASQTVTVAAVPKRIVSLAPANTEILFAIGAGPRVVGVTTYDDYPPAATKLPKVGDFMNPNLEAIAAAKPDLIVATTGVQAETLRRLKALGAVVVAIDPQSLAGAVRDVRLLGKATGDTASAEKVATGMEAAIADVKSKVADKAPTSVFVEIGQNPLYTVGAGTLIGDLVVTAGGKNVVAQKGYLPYSTEQLLKANPAVYLATKGSSNDPAAIEKRPGYAGLAAVKDGRVVILSDDLVSRGGPRIVAGLLAIAKALHPEAFPQQ